MGTSATGKAPASRRKSAFTEAPAWEALGGDGWRPLHGAFREAGYSIEWHDFTTPQDLDWSPSFHPGSVEICLNILGTGEVRAGKSTLALAPSTSGYYAQTDARLTGVRRGGERHQFITIELSLGFLGQHFLPDEQGLNPRLNELFQEPVRPAAMVSEPRRLTSEQQQLIMSLRRPPVYAAAQRLWYQAKALEVAATLLYHPRADEEFFCQRQKRLNQDRAQKVVAILKENIAEPPPLEEIGRRVGCSHFHLSRIFTQEMGKTISAYLRDLRMERAAALLREGKLNVTEVALSIGYSSLGHFSTAFHETFGCCPGLYPLPVRSPLLAKAGPAR